MFNSARAFSELEKSGAIPEGKLLFVNSIGSQALNSKENEELNRSYGHLLPRLVLEITEEEDLDPDALERKRRSVKTFALDDYGSGYNNEKSLLAISPAFIKMDLAIIRGINSGVMNSISSRPSSMPINAAGFPDVFSAITRWATPFNAVGTYSAIPAISASERNKRGALTEASHILNSSSVSCGVLSRTSYIFTCISPYSENGRPRPGSPIFILFSGFDRENQYIFAPAGIWGSSMMRCSLSSPFS